MLKKTLFLLFFVPLFAAAQILTPVKWTTETKDLGNNEYEVLLHATIDDGWHMYSQQHPDDGIGVPATIEFEANPNVEFEGEVKEVGKLIDAYSELFMQQEKFFENKVTFVQKIKLKDPKATSVSFSSEVQVCDDEKCLPPDLVDHMVKLVPSKSLTTQTEEPALAAADNDEEELSADEEDAEEDAVVTIDEITPADSTATASVSAAPKDFGKNTNPVKNASMWTIFFLGVSGGLLALVMPCVFPMIPLTVSLFTKQSTTRSKGIRDALIYGLSIVFIFVILAAMMTKIFGPSALNELSTNPWVNIGFFVIFIFFAISFFGAFELTLPSSWANFTDKQADKGGYLGIFFMALTLVIISFSCTLPIIGSLAAQAATTGNYYALIVGSIGFSVTLAIPFVLFAIFPSWMTSMPKSGGWMNTVKVTLGFLELAFAFKFLSNADLVWQAGWLNREIFIAIWITIFGLMGLYLLGKFKMTLDGPETRIGVPRLFFAIISFSFVVYLIPGLWGAPVNLVSGLTPPIHYAESPNGVGRAATMVAGNSQMGSELLEGQQYGPHQIPAFRDIAPAIAYSNQVNKPILIDFTGHACANCRKVEERVWSDPQVKNLLLNDVVLVSLYVDERTTLPEEEQVYSEALGRKLKTVGNKWTAFEIEQYQNNAQPYYIIVDGDLNEYNPPLGALYDVNAYLDWMNHGITGFHSGRKEVAVND